MAVSPLAEFTVEAPRRNHRGLRSPNPLKWVVIHSAVCCDGSTSGAESLARYLRDGAGGRSVSWHYSTDSNSVAASLAEEYSGRHTGSSFVDIHSLAIEMAVFVPGDWNKENYKKTLEITAKLTADICFRNGIPPEPLSASQLRANQNGIISHNLSRVVFGGTTHTDPGSNFPWSLFADRVAHYYAQSSDSEILKSSPIFETDILEPFTSVLQVGSSGPEVGRLQSYLKLKVDGEFGSVTKVAVSSFQKAQGIEADGIVGSITTERLRNPIQNLEVKKSAWLSDKLYRGKRGSSCYKEFVNIWQERFGLKPTGVFDLKTEAATLGFQAGVPGLIQDGIVGKSTWGTAMMLQ